MRKLKRWWKNLIAEWKLRGRRNQIARELQTLLALERPPSLKSSGSRGHDSNYFVQGGGKILGVLRIVNPYKKRVTPSVDMPFMLPETAHRLHREYLCYEMASVQGLAPKPLWRAEDAILCAYLPLQPLQKGIESNGDQIWPRLCAAALRLRDLHALKITHMDMSLANTLSDESLSKIAFVDFEYDAAPGVGPAAQRVYDHLRLVESVWKFIPVKHQGDYREWLKIYAASLDDEMKAVKLSTLAPALSRVLNAADLGRKIKSLHTW
jgi:hypothetical protein